MLPLLISVLLTAATQNAQPSPYLLQVDGETLGAFDSLVVTESAVLEVRLQQGWIDEASFRGLLGDDGNGVEIRPGEGRLPAGDVRRRTIILRQKMGSGLRQRSRAWVLIEACPVTWEIEKVNSETRRIHFDSITLVAREIAAEG